MATYDELNTIAGSNVLVDKIARAITISANTILNDGAATAPRKVWAKGAFNDPQGQAQSFQNAVLAANKDASVATIEGATDAAIQANVDAAIDIFAGA